MKIVFGALAALTLLGGAWSAQAQGVPQGSYLQSCGNVAIEGDTLVANCRAADGRERRTALNAVRSCVGDIGNNNGNLQCNHGSGGQSYRQPSSQPGYGSQQYDQVPQQRGYGAQPYGQSGYGQPR